MSGGYEQEEIPPSELLQKLLDLGIPRDVVEKAFAIMNEECLKKFAKWRRNFLERQKVSHVRD